MPDRRPSARHRRRTGRTRNRWLRVLIFVCLVVFCVGFFGLIREWSRSENSQKRYDALSDSVRVGPSAPVVLPVEDLDGETLAPEEETPKAPDFVMDFDALLGENPDTVGWLVVPGAEIDYPVMQGETNDTYLNDNFWHVTDWIGVPFVEASIPADFLHPNTIIYGHAITKGAMFTKLTRFKDPEVTRREPYIYLYTPDGLLRVYRIYGTHTDDAVSHSFWAGYQNTEDFAEYLDYCRGKQDYDTGVRASASDRIITLVTCEDDRNYRFIVQGRLLYEVNVRSGEGTEEAAQKEAE